jgi:drug/metabolite transporter (DMT)-like permease
LCMGALSAVFFLHLWTLDIRMVFQFGNAYFLAAALCWAFVTIVSQRVTASPFVYSFYAFGLVTPVLFFMASDVGIVLQLGWNFWGNMILIVGLGSLFATSVYFSAAQRFGAKWASLFLFVVPSSAVVFSFFMLGEIPTWPTIVGGVLALSGVYVLNYATKADASSLPR